MDTPTYNADGQAIWKPQPGEYFPGGLRYAHSYGGIVSALQDLQASKGSEVKTYPNNFAGIIAAIEDLQEFLTEGTLPDVGAPPPGWEIIINPDGSIDGQWQRPPKDGQMWFDTRQGRLFIAIDEEWVQTNGGDGIAHVGENPPTNPPVIGQSWLDTDTGLFYVYVGEGLWQAVVSDGDITVTTATLPLAIARSTFDVDDGTGSTEVYQPQVLPDLPSIDAMRVQKDYNTWLMEALVNLDKAVTEGSVSISDTPPTENIVPGTLWYDSRTLELSIYYEDDDSAQWVPVSVGFGLEEVTEPIRIAVEQEVVDRKQAVESLYSTIGTTSGTTNVRIDGIQADLDALELAVGGIEVPDISGLAAQSELEPILNRLSVVENKPDVNLTNYTTFDDLSGVQQMLINEIDSKTSLELSDITPLIPDVSTYVTQADIDASIDNITTEYLPRTGGTLTGSFVVQKDDYSEPAFDFSTAAWHSKCAFKFAANANDAYYTKFGTTETPWEYAWEFASDEDFCWIYNDTSKVFSITKDGPACSTLYVGDIGDNDANGRVIHNKIDVKERLNTYQTAFEQLRQGVSDANDFDSLKANILSVLASV